MALCWKVRVSQLLFTSFQIEKLRWLVDCYWDTRHHQLKEAFQSNCSMTSCNRNWFLFAIFLHINENAMHVLCQSQSYWIVGVAHWHYPKEKAIHSQKLPIVNLLNLFYYFDLIQSMWIVDLCKLDTFILVTFLFYYHDTKKMPMEKREQWSKGRK